MHLLIGQLARRCGLSASALRFYDECDLLRPSHVDPQTGYRCYDEDQVVTAELIRDLRSAGLPVAEVRAFLSASPTGRAALLLAHEDALTAQATTAQALVRAMRQRLSGARMTSMTVNSSELADALQQLVAITSQDDEQPLLQTVLIEAVDGSLRLVATDRHRLAVRDLAPLDGADAVFSALLPRAAVHRALASLAGTDGPVSILVDGDHLGLGELVFPRIKADFVAYGPLLEADVPEHVLLVGLADAIAAVPETGDVSVTFTSGAVLIGETRVVASYEGVGVTLLVNAQFLTQALASAAGPEVVLEASTSLRPLVVRSADSGTRVHLLMPIKPDI